MNHDFQVPDAIRYFLGSLSEAGQMTFEEKFFTDADFSEWLDEVETDLIDDYIRGELSATERMKFEENYLITAGRRARVKAAAALWENEKAVIEVTVTKVAKISFWEGLKTFFTVSQLSFAVPVILLLALLGGIVFFLRQPSNELAEKGNENINIPPIQTPFPTFTPESTSPTPTVSSTQSITPPKTATPNIKSSPSPIEKEKPNTIEAPQPFIATITLFPSLRGDGEVKKIILKKETKSLYLSLNRDLKGDFENYQVQLSGAGDNLILSQKLSGKKALGIIISTKKLQNGSYKITLKGEKTDGEFRNLSFYNFSIEKK